MPVPYSNRKQPVAQPATYGTEYASEFSPARGGDDAGDGLRLDLSDVAGDGCQAGLVVAQDVCQFVGERLGRPR
jgi:hypothetical protein